MTGVWVCANPLTHDGYRLAIYSTAVKTTLEWKLERWNAGVASKIASGLVEGLPEGTKISLKRQFAITAAEGKVQAWMQVEEGPWIELGAAEEEAFTAGFAGIDGANNQFTWWDAFYAGELALPPKPEPEPLPEVEARAATARHGYPDWQRLTLRLTQPLAWLKPLAPGAADVLGPFYVGNVPAVDLWLEQTAGNAVYTVKLEWGADDGFSSPVIPDTFRVGPESAVLRQRFACQGAWLRVTFTNTKQTVAGVYNFLLVPSDTLPPEPRFGNPLLVGVTAQAIKAAEEKTLTVARTAPGPAQLAFSILKGPALLKLEELQAAGTWSPIMSFATAVYGLWLGQRIVLPPAPVRLVTKGEAAEETTYNLALGLA
jgi:hypothetical protein